VTAIQLTTVDGRLVNHVQAPLDLRFEPFRKEIKVREPKDGIVDYHVMYWLFLDRREKHATGALRFADSYELQFHNSSLSTVEIINFGLGAAPLNQIKLQPGQEKLLGSAKGFRPSQEWNVQIR
jgi:hypothetical protein